MYICSCLPTLLSEPHTWMWMLHKYCKVTCEIEAYLPLLPHLPLPLKEKTLLPTLIHSTALYLPSSFPENPAVNEE